MSPQSVSPIPLQAPATLRVFEGSLFKPSVSHCHQDLEDLGTVCMLPREQLDQSEGPLHCRTGTHRQARGRASTPLSSPTNPTPAPRRELRTSREFLEEHTVANCACLSIPLSQFQQLAYTSGPRCQTTKMKSHLVFLTEACWKLHCTGLSHRCAQDIHSVQGITLGTAQVLHSG